MSPNCGQHKRWIQHSLRWQRTRSHPFHTYRGPRHTPTYTFSWSFIMYSIKSCWFRSTLLYHALMPRSVVFHLRFFIDYATPELSNVFGLQSLLTVERDVRRAVYSSQKLKVGTTFAFGPDPLAHEGWTMALSARNSPEWSSTCYECPRSLRKRTPQPGLRKRRGTPPANMTSDISTGALQGCQVCTLLHVAVHIPEKPDLRVVVEVTQLTFLPGRKQETLQNWAQAAFMCPLGTCFQWSLVVCRSSPITPYAPWAYLELVSWKPGEHEIWHNVIKACSKFLALLSIRRGWQCRYFVLHKMCVWRNK